MRVDIKPHVHREADPAILGLDGEKGVVVLVDEEVHSSSELIMGEGGFVINRYRSSGVGTR